MATYDVEITEVRRFTYRYRVEAGSGYTAGAKAALLHEAEPDNHLLGVETIKGPDTAKPKMVQANGQTKLPLEEEAKAAE